MGSAPGISRGCAVRMPTIHHPLGPVVSRGPAGRATASRLAPKAAGRLRRPLQAHSCKCRKALVSHSRGCLTSQQLTFPKTSDSRERGTETERDGEQKTEATVLYKTILEMTRISSATFYSLVGWPQVHSLYSGRRGLSSAS